jgi:hypothetical protein
MRYNLNGCSAARTKIFRVGAAQPGSAGAAARGKQPVGEPVKTIGKSIAAGDFHETANLAKCYRVGQSPVPHERLN